MLKFNFFKEIVLILLIGIGALLYVHQEIEIIKTGYVLEMRQARLYEILNQHRNLVYTLAKLENPENIERSLYLGNRNLYIPEKRNIFELKRDMDLNTKKQKFFLAGLVDKIYTMAEARSAFR